MPQIICVTCHHAFCGSGTKGRRWLPVEFLFHHPPGYFLSSKRNSDTWKEVSLDYDLLSYALSNLSCGSVYSFNLVAHNIAGRSKPSATITTPTLGSAPEQLTNQRIVEGKLHSDLTHTVTICFLHYATLTVFTNTLQVLVRTPL